MDSQEKWWPPNFAVSMMELALDALQVSSSSSGVVVVEWMGTASRIWY